MTNTSRILLTLIFPAILCQCAKSPKIQSNPVSPTDTMFHVDIFEPTREQIVNLTRSGKEADWEKHSKGSHPVRNTAELKAVHASLSTEKTPTEKQQVLTELEKMLSSSHSATVYSFEMNTMILVFFKKNGKMLGYYPNVN